MATYRTTQGDYYDSISKTVYGTEYLANILMRANPAYAAVVSFDAGVVLNVPQVSLTASVGQVPWSTMFSSSSS